MSKRAGWNYNEASRAERQQPIEERSCNHLFDSRLCCDGREHFYPCVVRGCNERQYFCKHLRNDRHCPQSAHQE